MTAHHRHQPGRHTWRIVLAKLTFDRQAEQLINNEIGSCADCWRDIADELAGTVWADTISRHGVPELFPSGRVEGAAIDYATHRVACSLRAAELDARHLGDEAA